MAGERIGQRKERWPEVADEVGGGGGGLLESAQEELVELLGWGRTAEWWPRLVDGRQRSKHPTDSPIPVLLGTGGIWEKWGGRKERKLSSYQPKFNWNPGIGTEKVYNFSSWYTLGLAVTQSLIFCAFFLSFFLFLSLSLLYWNISMGKSYLMPSQLRP